MFVLIMIVAFIIYSIKSSAEESSTSSMMFKTLAAYGQVVGIAALFPYKWPQEILKLFELLDMLTSVSDRLLNTDCALETRRGKGFPLIYEKAILYSMSPIIFACCATAVFMLTQLILSPLSERAESNRWKVLVPLKKIKRWIQVKSLMMKNKQMKRWTFEDTKRCVIVSIIVAMVVLHPTLTRQNVFLLMCVKVEETFYLRKDVQLECFTPEHNLMIGLVATPSIVAYVILWPALVYRVLSMRQHKMHVKGLGGHMTRSTYGFLYRGYSQKRFYWEIVIMMRKVLMVIVATVGLRATVQTQGMLALLVISISLAAHLQFKPFDEPSLDRLELYGLVTAFIILYR